MTVVNIALSDDDLSLARQRAAKHGFTEIEEYLRELVTEQLHVDVDDDERVDWGAPEHLHVTSKEQLKNLILEGEGKPAKVMTKEDWVQFRRELVERYGSGKRQ